MFENETVKADTIADALQQLSAQLQKLGAQSLSRGFEIRDHGCELVFTCRSCSNMWSLKKDSGHVGNVLHLLNHEAAHSRQAGAK